MTAVRRDQAYPDHLTGGYLCLLPVGFAHMKTRDKPGHRKHRWADMAHSFNEEQMGQRKESHSSLCDEHIGIMTL